MILRTDESSDAGGTYNNDSADVTSTGKSFQVRGPTTWKARLATLDSLTGGTTRRLVLVTIAL